jgi:hypothetical protein
LHIIAFWIFQIPDKIADLNYAIYSNLGIFLHTICHNLSPKVTPSLQPFDARGIKDYRMKALVVL